MKDKSNISSEDALKGVQEVLIVASPAHFDLTEADVGIAREQGLEITSIRARSAHADERLFDDQAVVEDERALALMQQLARGWERLPLPEPAEPQRYQLEVEPSYAVTVKDTTGRMLCRYAGGILIHNCLSYEDAAYFDAQLERGQSISDADAQRLVGRVLANLEQLTSDLQVPLKLDYEPGHSVVLSRTDGSVVFQQVQQTVLVNSFQPLEWQSLTRRLGRINDQSPDPDPDLER